MSIKSAQHVWKYFSKFKIIYVNYTPLSLDIFHYFFYPCVLTLKCATLSVTAMHLHNSLLQCRLAIKLYSATSYPRALYISYITDTVSDSNVALWLYEWVRKYVLR